MRFQNKQHLIDHIRSHSPRTAIVRAIDHAATVTLYGGFTEIPPSRWGGWIVTVESGWGATWHVAILTGPEQLEGHVMVIKEIPWNKWRGDNAKSEVAIGDVPAFCVKQKERMLNE